MTKKTTAEVIIPLIDKIKGSFVLADFYKTGLSRHALTSTISRLEAKGYLTHTVDREGSRKFYVYTKTKAWCIKKLASFSVTFTDVSGHLEKLTEANFVGTTYEMADFLGCPQSTIKNKVQVWIDRGESIHISDYVYRKNSPVPSAIYSMCEGEDYDIEDFRARNNPEFSRANSAGRIPSDKAIIKKAFKNGSSLVVLNGYKYVNPKSTQWCSNG